MAKQLLRLLTAITLTAALILGYLQKGKAQKSLLLEKVPPATQFREIKPLPLLLRGINPAEEMYDGYYILTEARGWGGPLDLATIVDDEGKIRNILVLSHRETVSFFYRLEKKEYFQQFLGKHIADPFLPDRDIDTVTQATVSSKAVAQAVRLGSHILGREIFGLEITEEKSGWSFGGDEILLLLLIAAAPASWLVLKHPFFRYAVMLASFIFLGFMRNASLSIAHFGALLLGYFPPIPEYPFWWILLGNALLFPLLLRKNLYCHSLCPFGNLQELNTKITGINLPLGTHVNRGGHYVSYVLTWFALVVIFYKTNPALGAYEPFPTLFGLDGIEVQWFVLSTVIFGSFFLSRFFCRFFCPVGVVLNLLVKVRRAVDRFFRAKASCPE